MAASILSSAPCGAKSVDVGVDVACPEGCGAMDGWGVTDGDTDFSGVPEKFRNAMMIPATTTTTITAMMNLFIRHYCATVASESPDWFNTPMSAS